MAMGGVMLGEGKAEGEPLALLAPSATPAVGTRAPRGYARAAMAT